MRASALLVLLGPLLLGCGGATSPAGSPSAASTAASPASLGARAGAGTQPSPAPSGAAVQPPAGSAQPSGAGTKITIAYATDSGETAPAWVGVDMGFYRRYGLDVTASHAQGSLSVDALLSGSVQASFTGGADAFTAIAAGTPIKLVMVLVKENPYAIVVRPDIKTPADLKGQALAIGKLGDTSDVSAHIALSRFGLDPAKDVVERQIGNSPARAAALQSGQVAGAIEDQAFSDMLVKQGNHVLVSLAQDKVPYIANGLAVTATYAQQQPQTVEGLVRGTYDGLQYVLDQSHRQEVLAVIGKYQRADPASPVVAGIYQAMVASLARDPTPEPAGAETILKALQAMDPARYAKLAAGELIDPSFIQRAKSGS
jgi:ABC-type nitrate/sulfonate/bicarbonate transport system substrate-binding protein